MVDIGSLDGSGSVAGFAAMVAPIDPFLGPAPFRLGYRAVARGVESQVDLVFRFGHVSATIGLIMNFIITIGLLVLVDDELGHDFELVMDLDHPGRGLLSGDKSRSEGGRWLIVRPGLTEPMGAWLGAVSQATSAKIVAFACVRVRTGGLDPINLSDVVVRVVPPFDFPDELRTGHFHPPVGIVEALVTSGIRLIGYFHWLHVLWSRLALETPEMLKTNGGFPHSMTLKCHYEKKNQAKK